MDWITDEIAIGDWRDAQNAELLSQESIWSILSLVAFFIEHR
jgi:hypothetical protein